MPLSSTELNALTTTAATLSSQINALIVDTVDVAQMQADLAQAQAAVVTLQGNIANSKLALQAVVAADTAEDAAVAQALAALG